MCSLKTGSTEGSAPGGTVVITIGNIISVLKAFFTRTLNYMELTIKKYWIDIGENHLSGVTVTES